MKTCFISRLGGAGDVLHAAHLPRLIKEHYGVQRVDFETNYHGMHILTNNPYIDNLIYLDVSKLTTNRMVKNLEHCSEVYDLCFNLANTIELKYCTNENDQRYYRSDSWRRENLGKISYYDVMTKAVGLPESYFGTRGRLYFDRDNLHKATKWIAATKEKYSSDFLVLVNLSGSSLHKKFVQAESIVRKWSEKDPKAFFVLTGDNDCKSQVFEHPRVFSAVGKWNFRSAALMCKYFDLTISLETGLALVAHSWDAPTLQLLTAASFDNHVKYAKNAYWLQAETPCSPCHRNPREYFGCPTQDKLPACVFFNEEKILEKIEKVRSNECRTIAA